VSKHFISFEGVIADEDFLSWYTDRSSPQAIVWQNWLTQHPQYQPLVDESIYHLNTLKLSDKPVRNEQIEDAHERLMRAIHTNATVVQIKSRRMRWWLSAAAAVLLIITGAALWNNSKNSQVNVNTAYGQVTEYKLPDGSEVMLNANSKLSMKKTWENNGDREVWLEGEAFFHVKKTTAKNRFIVHAEEVDIIVTGTQFNVVNREGESNVLLKEGSVTLKTKGGQLLNMRPGDFVTINNHQPLKEAVPEEKVLAWTQAKLVFENTPIVNAAKTISQHYGVKVIVDKNAQEKRLSGILPNDNLEVLLKALEAMDLQIERKSQEVIISNPKS
jgi:ferric-dicitrate binding protein FerR (iron transport regulator)